MGSFAGHIDEGIFFVLIALWWMYCIFPDYIGIKQKKKGEFCSKLSYRAKCCCNLPVETFFKIAFPFAGFLAELFDNGPHFFDEDGNFQKLNPMQHMTIYGIFVLHGVVDLSMQFGVPFPPGLDYLTIALSFFWYGTSFHFHSHMPGKPPLEVMIHVLPITLMVAIGVSFLLDLYTKSRSILICMFRIYGLLVLGSWFIHISFVLYLPTPFPGSHINPAWSRTDHRNVHFIVAAFGFHLCLHLVTVLLGYVLCFWITRRKISGDKLPCRDECQSLMEANSDHEETPA